jgi:SOS-response transcriptional repressor LexA
MSDDSRPGFTARQGQYLAFIHAYTLVNGRPPAEADMQRFFRASGPAVHQMVIALERQALIRRKPGMPRSIQLLISAAQLPQLHPANQQPVRTTVQRYSHVRRFK